MILDEIIDDNSGLWSPDEERLPAEVYALRVFKQAVKEGNLKINVSINGEIDKAMQDICFQSLVKIREILADKSKSEFECIESIEDVLDETIGGVEHYTY